VGGLLTAGVVVVADDLIWSTRIAEAVNRAGGRPVALSSEEELAVALEATVLEDEQTIHGAIVDLAARRLDGVAAIERVAAARLPVIAVAEHDDQLTRKRALAAGATRVFSYRKFFEDGSRLVAGWLAAERGPS
jgi:DNA-binding NarL/FixJ family response regulator